MATLFKAKETEIKDKKMKEKLIKGEYEMWNRGC